MTRKLLLIIGITVAAMVVLGVIIAATGNSLKHGEVVVVPIDGMIVSPDRFVQDMEDLRKDKSVKAIVLRIDSPGGAVAAGQEMTAVVQKVVSDKPVVVSMGNVAASAGYYIASASSFIVANPGTVTASIGVRMEHAEINKLLDTLGIKLQNLKSGALKDIGTYDRPMTSEERAVLEAMLREMHEQFITTVAQNRKLSVDAVRQVADGRPMTGSDALKYKLIDALGGEQEAIAKAGELAKIDGEPTVRRMKAGPPWWQDLLFDSMTSVMRKAVGALRTIAVSTSM
jgi:protease-4